jgi:CRISPR/Cas system-associated endonuclease/helicase Cas3
MAKKNRNINNDIKNDIESNIENNVDNDIENDVESDVKNDIEKNVESNTKNEVENNVKNNIENKVKNDIKNNVKNDICSVIEGRLEMSTPFLVKAVPGCVAIVTNKGTGSFRVLNQELELVKLLAGEKEEVQEGDFYLKATSQPFFKIEFVKKG